MAQVTKTHSETIKHIVSMRWNVCRVNFARKIFFEPRIFLRKMLRKFPRNVWAFVLWVRKNPRKIPSKFPTKFSTSLRKIKKKSPTSFCRSAGRILFQSGLDLQSSQGGVNHIIWIHHVCGHLCFLKTSHPPHRHLESSSEFCLLDSDGTVEVEIRSGPGKPNQKKSVHELFAGAFRNKSSMWTVLVFLRKNTRIHKNRRNSWTFRFGPFFGLVCRGDSWSEVCSLRHWGITKECQLHGMTCHHHETGKSHPWTNTSAGGNFRRTFRTIGPYGFPQENVWTNDWSIWISPEICMDQWRSKFSESFSLDRYWSIECSSLWKQSQSPQGLKCPWWPTCTKTTKPPVIGDHCLVCCKCRTSRRDRTEGLASHWHLKDGRDAPWRPRAFLSCANWTWTLLTREQGFENVRKAGHLEEKGFKRTQRD